MNENLNIEYINNFLQPFVNEKQDIIKYCLIIGIDHISTFMSKSTNLVEDLKIHAGYYYAINAI